MKRPISSRSAAPKTPSTTTPSSTPSTPLWAVSCARPSGTSVSRPRSGQTLVFPTHGRLPAARLALLGLGKARHHRHLRACAPSPAAPPALAQHSGAKRLALLPPLGLSRPAARTVRRRRAPGRRRAPRHLPLRQVPLRGQAHPACRWPRSAAARRRARRAARPTPSRAAERVAARHRPRARSGQRARRLHDPDPPGRGGRDGRHQARASAVTVLGPDECRQRGMGLFLAVAQGSAEEPRFIHLAWKPPSPRKRVVLIGKGVTFDSGGLSLKPNDGMLDMKTDMAGAAAVIAADGRRRRREAADRGPRAGRLHREHALRHAPTSWATCCARRPARPWRSTTPTPRAA